MKRITLIMIPDQTKKVRQFRIPSALIKIGFLASLSAFSVLGFLLFDYLELRSIRSQHHRLIAENQHLKGEAQILMGHLEEVKHSLRRVQDYTSKLSDLVNFRVKKVSRKTGIGPLTNEEFKQATSSTNDDQKTENLIPLGINIDKLILRPVFEGLSTIGRRSTRQAVELQHLLSTLSQKKSLLSSIPSISPVRGWVTSKFGYRISPFTGKRALHKGIDIAAPVGTPIRAPADGVAIFSGAKAGFGNFVMIAHYGSGIVTGYGHNSQNMVRAGQKVSRGDQIGSVGMTGRSTGPHLHYEVWVNGQPTNPRKFILNPTASYALSN